MEILA